MIIVERLLEDKHYEHVISAVATHVYATEYLYVVVDITLATSKTSLPVAMRP